MLAKVEAEKMAIRRIQEIFGLDYLRANRQGSCTSRGYWPDSGESMMFIGIKDSKALPDHKKNRKGWTVYAEIWIDIITGKIKREDFLTE
ncbi:MAG: hypothetical protein IJU38_05545 [Clostridia bacterium]|nr:hypothetical protein [Clostridia bacterium]